MRYIVIYFYECEFQTMTRKYNTLNKFIDTFTTLKVKDCKECYVDNWHYSFLNLGYCSWCNAKGRHSHPIHFCGQPWKICESYGCSYDASQRCRQCNLNRIHENHLHNHRFIIKSNYEPICLVCMNTLSHPVHAFCHKFEISIPMAEKGEWVCAFCKFPASKHKYSVYKTKKHPFINPVAQSQLDQKTKTPALENQVDISA